MGALEEIKPQQLKSILCCRNSATKNNGRRRLREEVQKEAEELHRPATAETKWIFLHDIDTLTQSQKKNSRGNVQNSIEKFLRATHTSKTQRCQLTSKAPNSGQLSPQN